MIPKTFWKSFCGLTRQKWNFLEGVHPITSGVKLQQHFRTHVQHGGCGVMVLGCFASSGPGRLGAIDGTMNSARYQKILTESVRPSVHHLKLKLTRVMQQDNDPKHTSKSTYEWLKKNKWPSQSLDFSPIEMLWHDLKEAIHGITPQCGWIKNNSAKNSGPKFLDCDVKDSLPVIANAWLQVLLPRVAQPLIRFRGQLLFHIGPGWFGQLFTLYTLNHLL